MTCSSDLTTLTIKRGDTSPVALLFRQSDESTPFDLTSYRAFIALRSADGDESVEATIDVAASGTAHITLDAAFWAAHLRSRYIYEMWASLSLDLTARVAFGSGELVFEDVPLSPSA